jgi:hypothetical protein
MVAKTLVKCKLLDFGFIESSQNSLNLFVAAATSVIVVRVRVCAGVLHFKWVSLLFNQGIGKTSKLNCHSNINTSQIMEQIRYQHKLHHHL